MLLAVQKKESCVMPGLCARCAEGAAGGSGGATTVLRPDKSAPARVARATGSGAQRCLLAGAEEEFSSWRLESVLLVDGGMFGKASGGRDWSGGGRLLPGLTAACAAYFAGEIARFRPLLDQTPLLHSCLLHRSCDAEECDAEP